LITPRRVSHPAIASQVTPVYLYSMLCAA
jgi:hypothetical protein